VKVDGEEIKFSNNEGMKLSSDVCDYIVKDTKVLHVDLESKKIQEIQDL
jgi:hypothetical protein